MAALSRFSATVSTVLAALAFGSIAVASPLTVWAPPATAVDEGRSFELCAMHEGAIPASDIRIRLPLGAASVLDSSPSATIEDGAAVWQIGVLAPGQSRCVEVTLDSAGHAPVVTGVAGGALRFEAARGGEFASSGAPTESYGETFDSYVVAQVARLGGDRDAIVAFVRDEVRWVPYDGALRGARGTLWAREGNAIDRATLLVEMLRAAGSPARLSRGTLGESSIDALLETLQPDWNRIASAPLEPADLVAAVLALDGASEQLIALGYPPAPEALAEALTDELFDRTEARARWSGIVSDHWWVESYDEAWRPESTLPVAPPALEESHYEVPEDRKHTVRLVLEAELYNPAFAPLGGAPSEVLDTTIPTSELVGRPATLWIESDVRARGGLIFASTERDYYPTLRAGGELLVTGDRFSELVTSFPLASTFVMGVELAVTLTAPDGSSETRDHVISDRLGAAARTGYGGDIERAIGFSSTTDVSGLTGMDTVTISVGAGDPASTERMRIRSDLQRSRAALTEIAPKLDELLEDGGAIRGEADQFTSDTALRLGLEANTAQGEYLAARYLDDSSLFTAQMAQEMLVRAWDASPRLVISGMRSTDGGGAPFIDLVRHETEVWAPSNVPSTATTTFQLVRSEFEAELEASSVAALAPGDGVLVSLPTVWAAANDAGIPIRELRPGDEADLARLDIDIDARARMNDALSRGQNVFTPDRMVVIDGVEAIVWAELDPSTGHYVAVGANGWRMAAVQYAALDNILSKALGVWIGGLHGFTYGTLIGISQVLDASVGKVTASGAAGGVAKCGIGSINPGFGLAVAGFNSVTSGELDALGLIQALIEAAAGKFAPGVASFISGYNTGFCIGALIGHMRVQMAVAGLQFADPPIPQAGSGALDPWRRPIWVARFPAIGRSGAVSDPTLGTFEGLALGTMAISLGDLNLFGSMTVAGSGTTLEGVNTVEVTSVGWNIDRWQGPVTAAQGSGELGIAGGFVSIELDYLSGESDGFVTVRRVNDDGSTDWVTLDAGEWELTATGARGLLESGDTSFDEGTLVVGESAWPDAAFSVAAGSASLAAFDSSGAVSLGGVPSTDTRDVGERWLVEPDVFGSLTELGEIGVEAPEGWRVEPTTSGYELWPRGALAGTHIVQTWIEHADGRRLARQSTEVTLVASGSRIEVELTYQPLYTTQVGDVPIQMVASAIIRNSGDSLADVSATFDAGAEFEARAGWSGGQLAPGEDAFTWVSVVPLVELPAPGTPIELTLDAVADGVSDSDTITWDVPEAAGLSFVAVPVQSFGLPGSSGVDSLELTGLGNATREIRFEASPAADIDYEGIPATITLAPGETRVIEVPWTLRDSAKPGFAYGTVIDAFDGDRMLGRAILSTLVLSPAMDKAYAAAREAALVAPDPLGTELIALGELLAQFDGTCTRNAMRELEFRMNVIATAADGLLPPLVVAELRAQADAILESDYGCDQLDLDWLCATLEQIAASIAEIDDALSLRVVVGDLNVASPIESGETLAGTLRVSNEDDEVSEAVSVRVSARQRGAATVIATLGVPPLAPGESMDLGFDWDTSDALGDYIIEATGPRNEAYTFVTVDFASAPDGNRAPVFGLTPPDRLEVGVETTIALDVTDPDGDTVFVSRVSLPIGFSLEGEALVGMARSEGDAAFSLVATDRYGATATLEFQAFAGFAVDNQAPVLTSRPQRTVLVDREWSYTPRGFDPEGTELTWRAIRTPDGVGFDGATLSWTPGLADVGLHWFDTDVTDEDGNRSLHSFPVLVNESPLGADLVPDSIIAEWDSTERGPFAASVEVLVRNGGDTNAAGSRAEIRLGNADGEVLASADVPSLVVGADWTGELEVAGTLAFEGQPLVVVVDSVDAVSEANETNNVLSTAGRATPTEFAYMAAPPTAAEVIILSPNEDASFRLLDPESRQVASQGVAPAGVPTLAESALRDGDSTFPLTRFLVETDAAVQVYVVFEVFDPDVGGDLFHPALDGSRIGSEFLVYVPTASANNGLFVTALEELEVTQSEADGTELATIGLSSGQTWSVEGVTHGDVLRLSATGSMVVQSASITGAAMVPPTSETSTSHTDVGRNFVFSTRSRGLGGGAIGVVAYEDAAYVVEVAEGVLIENELSAGEAAFHPGVGELRGANLHADGDVSVVAGDISRLGADRFGLIGEDLVHTTGRGGQSFIAHTLENDTIVPYVFAGPNATIVVVDGETNTLNAFERLVLPENSVVAVQTSQPVVIQTMGGGDRYFDYASVLPSLTPTSAEAVPVLSAPAFDLDDCGTSVIATMRIGNAGSAEIPAGAEVVLAVLGDTGPIVMATQVLAALPSGSWTDVSVAAAGAVSAETPSWTLTLSGTGFEPIAAVRPGTDASGCVNLAPTFETSPPTSVDRSSTLRYTARATDPEGSEIRYDLIDAPTGTSLHPRTGQLEWQPTVDAAVGSFAISAADERGGLALQTFIVTITEENCLIDEDEDTYCPPTDCDDTRPDVNPSETEIPGDGVDNDCDPTTSDAIPPGGVSIVVSTEFTTIARGAPLTLIATVTEHTGVANVDGLQVNFNVECAGESVFNSALTDTSVSAGESVLETVDWTETDVPATRCTVTASVLDGSDVLDESSIVIALGSGLEGRFLDIPRVHSPTDALALDWEITNTTDASLTTNIEVRRADRLQPLVSQDVAVDAGAAETQSAELDSTAWPEALLTLRLVNGDALLDEVQLAMQSTQTLYAPGAPVGRALEWLPGGDGVAVRYQPDGPANQTFPAVVQAAWESDVLALGITLLSEDVRTVSGRLFRDGQAWTDFAWTADEPGGASVDQTERGERLTWSLAASSPLALGAEITMNVEVETADARWWWSNGPSLDATDAAVVELLDGDDPVEPSDPGSEDVGLDVTSPDADDQDAPDAIDGSGATEGGSGQLREHDGGCNCTSSESGGRHVLWLFALLLALRVPRPSRRLALWVGTLSVMGLTVGCGDRAPDYVVDVEFDGSDATTGSDVGLDQRGGGGDAGGTDTGELDTGADAQVPPGPGEWPDSEPVETAETGDECETADDCASGICQDGVDFSVCSELCETGSCPEDFSCEVFPGGVQICVALSLCLDADGDGYGRGRGCDGADCEDSDATVWSGAVESCDGIDNNCDGVIDEGVLNDCGNCGPVPEETCNGFDDDCDGDIDEGVANACGECGLVPVEVCNGLDDDCDGTPDNGVCLECELGETRSCYAGPDDTDGTGLCGAGEQRCETAGWSVCVGAVLPVTELCDGEDNDCDGDADEGLLNACGTCEAVIVELCDGVDNDCDSDVDEGVQSACGGCTPCGESRVFPFERGTPEATIAPAPDGGITLGTGLLERHDIWVPNSLENTVSRWDTRTGRELGRYWIGEDPSRTAVDLDGNVWIGNRGDGIVTHIFGDQDRCIDRNGDGVIQTSRDLNGDGRITGGERLADAEGDALVDECVHCQVRVGTATDLVRGVGVDAENHAWVGTWSSRELYEIDPETCEILTQISTGVGGGTTSQSPVYGIAIDPDGFLWTSSYTADCMPQVNTRTGETVDVVCDSRTRYGLAIAPDGTLWFGGANAEIHSYTPETREWATFAPPEGGVNYTAGIVVDTDGHVFVAGYNSNNIGRFDPETGTWLFFPTNPGSDGFAGYANPRGVTIDAEGHLWAIARTGSGLVEMTTDGEWIGSYRIVSSDNPSAGTSPYSYSDNTGFQLFNIVAREGAWTDVFDVGAPVRFLEVDSVTVEPESTSIDLRYRIADDPRELAGIEWSEWAPAAGVTDLRGVAPDVASVIEVQYRLLTADPEIRPVLRGVTVRYETDDCREASGGCPSGQICDPVYGGCLVPPTECSRDAQCSEGEYCDETGGCRIGCRLSFDSCEDGRTCDPESHRCLFRTFECASDSDCGDGTWCTDGGFCEAGCRVAPDSCPIAFRCDAGSRACDPVPPECVLDTECADGTYCNTGRCTPGCRVDGGCAELERCETSTRLCVALPEACDPEAITDEVCNGLDDDCDGVIDNAVIDAGVTCEVGQYHSGETVCAEGELLCRHDGAGIAAGTTLMQYATAVVGFSSQRFSTSWGAGQALGAENAVVCRDDAAGWAPSPTDAEPQFLHLAFDVPLDANSVRIREINPGGFVTAIDVVLDDGTLVEGAWTGVDDTLCGEWLDVDIDVDGLVHEVVIHTAAEGREVIDAVQLVGETVTSQDPILLGPIENVWLDAVEYQVAAQTLIVTDAFRSDDGTLLARSDSTPWMFDRGGEGNGFLGASTFLHATLDWRGSGALVMTGTVFESTPESDRNAYIAADALRMDGVSAVDVPFETAGGTPAVVISGRHVSTSGTDWQWQARGPTEFIRTELLGELAVPRRSKGIYASAPIVLRDSEVSRMTTGLEVRSTEESLIVDSRIADSDVCVRVASSGVARFDGANIDLGDLGHVGDGVLFDRTTTAAAAHFDDVTFRGTARDTALVLDVDVFQDDTTTTWGSVTFDGIAPDEAVALATNASGGAMTIAPLPFSSRFRVRESISFTSSLSLNVEDVTLYTDENTARILTVTGGAVATFDNVSFENIEVSQTDSSGLLTITNSDFSHRHIWNRNLLAIYGVADVSATSFTSLGTPANTSSRIHTGVYVYRSGDMTLTGCSFNDFRYGLYAEDTSILDISTSDFVRCQTGLRIQETAVGTLTDLTFSDDSELVSSVGLYCAFSPGGSVAVDGIHFEMGGDDRAISIEPDVFSLDSPSTFTDVTFGDDVGSRVGMRGDGTAPNIVFAALGGETTFELYEGTRILEPAVATFAGAITFESAAGGIDELQIGGGASLTTSDGVSFIDVPIRTWGALHATGTRFEGTGRTYNPLIDVQAGTLDVDESTLLATRIRAQDGIRVNGSGFATVNDVVFMDLDEAAYIATAASFDATGSTFDGCRIGLSATGAFQASATDCSILSGTEVHTTGAYFLNPADGLVLDLSDTYIDLEPEHDAFTIPIEGFLPGRTVTIDGTTTGPRGIGEGYIVYGTLDDGDVTLSHLEAGQTAWRLYANLTINGDVTLTIPPGTVIASDENVRVLDFNEDTHLQMTGASMSDVQLRLDHSASATIADSAFVGVSAGRRYLNDLTTTGPISISNTSYTAEDTTTDTRGITVTGDGSSISIDSCTFDSLNYGVVASSPPPTLTNPTFLECNNDTSGFP